MEKYVAVMMSGDEIQLVIPQKWYGVLDCNGYNRGINKNVKRVIFYSPFSDDVEPNFQLPISRGFQSDGNACYEVFFLQICDTKDECLHFVKNRRVFYPAVYNEQRLHEFISAPRLTLNATTPASKAAVTPDDHLDPNILFEGDEFIHDHALDELVENSGIRVEQSTENADQSTEPNSEYVSTANGSFVVSEISSGFSTNNLSPSVATRGSGEYEIRLPVAGADANAGMSMRTINETVADADELGIATTSVAAHEREKKRNRLVAAKVHADAENPIGFNGLGQVSSSATEREEDGNRLPAAGANLITGTLDGSSCSEHVSAVAVAAAHHIDDTFHGRETAQRPGEIAVSVKIEAKLEVSERIRRLNENEPIIDLTDLEDELAFSAAEINFDVVDSDSEEEDIHAFLDLVPQQNFAPVQVKFDGDDILSGDMPYNITVSIVLTLRCDR